MSDPFEFLRQQAQAEQWSAAVGAATVSVKTMYEAFAAAGLPPSLCESLTLAWFRLVASQALGAK